MTKIEEQKHREEYKKDKKKLKDRGLIIERTRRKRDHALLVLMNLNHPIKEVYFPPFSVVSLVRNNQIKKIKLLLKT